MKDGYLALVFTALGGLWTLITYIKNSKDNDLKLKQERIKTIREYHKDLREWANCVIDLLSSAGHLCLLDPKKDPEFYSKRHNLLIELSAMADKGRFFLPNSDFEARGLHKPAAFRGFRSDAIDSIVKCYNLVGDMSYTDKNAGFKNQILKTQRDFVSAIHIKLDPRKFEIELIEEIKHKL